MLVVIQSKIQTRENTNENEGVGKGFFSNSVVEEVAYDHYANREFKIYDATVAKTSLKIASSSFSIYFPIMSVCLTFES